MDISHLNRLVSDLVLCVEGLEDSKTTVSTTCAQYHKLPEKFLLLLHNNKIIIIIIIIFLLFFILLNNLLQ